MKRWMLVAWAVVALLLVSMAGVAYLNLRGEEPVSSDLPAAPNSEQVARGAYLARMGNCMGCHTRDGGAPYAGAKPIETPFGLVFSSNLTPDKQTGLGMWSTDHFWRALHHGRSRDGRLLSPAFPYTEYTRVSRADADDLFAYLRSLPPVTQPQPPHEMTWPYGSQWGLAVWRSLYFRVSEPAVKPSAETPSVALGRYWVHGLAHCASCHGGRGPLGGPAPDRAWGGFRLPGQSWYAPALDRASEAGVAHWSVDDIVALLATGVNRHATVSGPMAEVVHGGTQYLRTTDLEAMALYLKSIPEREVTPMDAEPSKTGLINDRGQKLYERHCVQCHGAKGEGVSGAYPALAGNRAVTMAVTTNLVRMVLSGGYSPSTAGNPMPHGMPPFRQQLSDEEVAHLLTYIRGAWGNHGSVVTILDVLRDQ